MRTIRALRQARGWTQFDLALKVGVQPHAVYLWESGRRIPQVPQLRKLGMLFGMCSDEIDLEPARDVSTEPDRPHTDRDHYSGEPSPSLDAPGRATARSHAAPRRGLPLAP